MQAEGNGKRVGKIRVPAVLIKPTPANLLAGAVSIQQGTVLNQIRRVHRNRPDGSPAEILSALEKVYLATVTSAGTLVGGAAAVPAVGTGTALALSSAEVVGFLEATALYTLAVAEIYGVPVYDLERRQTVLMTVLLGQGAVEAVEKAAGRTAPYWGKSIVNAIPMSAIRKANSVLGRNFVTKFGTKQGILVLGRAIPFGIGAAIGGVGNAATGVAVIKAVRRAYGPPPTIFPPTVLRASEARSAESGNDQGAES